MIGLIFALSGIDLILMQSFGLNDNRFLTVEN
jgi:hypothetical protein